MFMMATDEPAIEEAAPETGMPRRPVQAGVRRPRRQPYASSNSASIWAGVKS
jgi:hypothetical protein